jgi:hypothetical protein
MMATIADEFAVEKYHKMRKIHFDNGGYGLTDIGWWPHQVTEVSLD